MEECQTPYWENSEEEVEINLKSLLFFVLRRYRFILVLALVCTVIGGGFGLFRDYRAQSSAEESEAASTAEETESPEGKAAALEIYEKRLQANEESQRQTLQSLERAQDYLENSLLNSIDPNGVAWANADLYFKLDSAADAGADALARLAEDLQSTDDLDAVVRVYSNFLTSSETLRAVGEQFDLEEPYMRELVSVSSSKGSGLLSVSVQADTTERAEAFLDAILEQLDASEEELGASVEAHTVEKLPRSSGVTVSTALSNQQKNNSSNLSSLESTLQNLEKQHTTLEDAIASMEEEEAQGRTIRIGASLPKFAAIGFLGGAVLACGLVALQFMLQGRVYTAQELKDNCRLPILGVLAGEKTQTATGLNARIDRWEGRPAAAEAPETCRLIAATIHSRVPQAKTILVTGDLPPEKLNALAEKLRATEYLADVEVTAAECILETPDTVPQAAAADAIVLAADRACSRYAAVNAQHERLYRLGKNILGCVVFE